MADLLDPELDTILEGTSRSFYLSLKELPSGVRSQVGLLYLLARTSDTIADSERGSTEDRLVALEQYNEYAQGRSDTPPDLSELARLQRIGSERKLLESVAATVSCIGRFRDSDQLHIRRCLDIIVGGQSLDLQRFSAASEGQIVALEDDGELDDYAYRVAGSVGEFWTRMTLDHLYDADAQTEAVLFEKGVRFGKALQLINILRDIPEDMRMGRCYIPSSSLSAHGMEPADLLDKGNMERFRPLFDSYIDIAESHLDAAVEYIGMLPHSQLRLRGACMLPVLIGQRTLSLLREGNVLDSDSRIKITRSDINGLLKRVALAIPFAKSSEALLNEYRDA
jgi:farnesyl-diphosphate farnesyltransferase|tara:strand:- start:80 stop:1093 length:1014 start_codon:yes stop_codon:yes gene_type:complete